MITALALCLLAAEPAYVPSPEEVAIETDATGRAAWMAGGAVVWAPIGTLHGLLVGSLLPRSPRADATKDHALGSTVGALVGIGVGMMLGWFAHQGSNGAKLGILIPAAAELIALIACAYAFR